MKKEEVSHSREHPTMCAECSNSHPSSKWHNMLANDMGWFHMKNGKSYCPEHTPEWVEEWRRYKNRKNKA